LLPLRPILEHVSIQTKTGSFQRTFAIYLFFSRKLIKTLHPVFSILLLRRQLSWPL